MLRVHPMLEQSVAAKTDPLIVDRLLREFHKTVGVKASVKQQGHQASSGETHRCGRGCSFWTDRRAPYYYVCVKSGRVHVCAGACAAHAFETRESTRVCSLTGIELQGCGLVSSYADAERVLPPSQYNHAKERKSTRQTKLKHVIIRELKGIVPPAATSHQVDRFVQTCMQVYQNLCSSKAWDTCERAEKTFAFTMAYELSNRNTFSGSPVPWLEKLKFADVQDKTMQLKMQFAKMQKKVRKAYQDATLRPYFRAFNALKYT